MLEIQIEEFYIMVQDILESDEFIKMSTTKHHIKTSVYDHCLKVAFLCYKHHYRFHCKTDIYELVRSALLHDYFLYDRIDKSSGDNISRFKHAFKHPTIALNNAIEDYPDLTYREQNAIKRHMFPLTVIPPTSKCGWLVCCYDKVAAIGDYLHIQRWKKELEQYCPQILK
jgi:uncharacterized protein